MHQVKHMAIQFPCSFGASVFQTPMQSNNQIQLKKNTCNQYACPQKFNEKEKQAKSTKTYWALYIFTNFWQLHKDKSANETKILISSLHQITDKYKHFNLLPLGAAHVSMISMLA